MQRPMSASSSRAGTATHGAQRGHGSLLQASGAPPRRRRRRPGRGRRPPAVRAGSAHECAVAVGLHARLVEAVAPRRVLERVVADGGPEARRGRPRRVLAGERAARDLAVRERVAPVLDAQAPAGAGVLRPRRCRPTASTAGSELRIEASTQHGAVLDVEAGVGGQLAAGATPVPRTTRSAASSSPPASRTRQRGSMRSTSAPRRTSTPASHSSAVMSSPARSPRRCGLRTRLGRDERPRRARARTSDAAASQAMKPAPTTTARAPAGAAARRRRASSTVRMVCRPGSSAPVDRRALRRRAGGEHAGVVGSSWPPSSATRRRPRSSATARRRPAQRHRVGGEPGLASSGRSRARPRRAGTPWSAAGGCRAGAARRR